MLQNLWYYNQSEIELIQQKLPNGSCYGLVAAWLTDEYHSPGLLGSPKKEMVQRGVDIHNKVGANPNNLKPSYDATAKETGLEKLYTDTKKNFSFIHSVALSGVDGILSTLIAKGINLRVIVGLSGGHLVMGGGNHAIGLSYDSGLTEWTLFDPNSGAVSSTTRTDISTEISRIAGTFHCSLATFLVYGPKPVSTGLCYICTATCNVIGLEDNCDELQTLRWFRDTILLNTPCGQEIVNAYYSKAPGIVTRLQDSSEAKNIYEDLYYSVIVPACKNILLGHYNTAFYILWSSLLRLDDVTSRKIN